jgi:hypothetical protein
VCDITQEAWQAEANSIREKVGQYGVERMAFEACRVRDTDDRAQLIAIKVANPE